VSGPALVAVAHGSTDPAAANAVSALAEQVRRLAPVLDIRTAFVQHAERALEEELAEAGPGTIVVPLLLSSGYHLTSDIAPAAEATRARVAPPLGPDDLLTVALLARLREAGVPQGTPVVLAAAGSADPLAAQAIEDQVKLLAADIQAPVLAAFAAAGQPAVSDAVAALRAATNGPVAIATYLLAPGHFHERLQHAGADWVTAPLADHPAVAALVIDRYRAARLAA
jgi:sirohydrochlorin ferrochelatase